VKFDGHFKARLVTNGSKMEQPKDDIFSGFVGLESVQLTFLLAQINVLQVCAADISNAFLYGQTREKVYIKAGHEFGAAIAGQPLIIDKGSTDFGVQVPTFMSTFCVSFGVWGINLPRLIPISGSRTARPIMSTSLAMWMMFSLSVKIPCQ
jgi:hypothetical protein